MDTTQPGTTRLDRVRHRTYVVAGAVALLTWLTHLASLRNGFVEWDDGIYVVENPFIRAFDWTFPRSAILEFHASNWHPLTWFSHALDYAVWGLNPVGHHLTSVILHGANAFLVVLLAGRLIAAANRTAGGSPDASADDWPALIAAAVTGLLFGLHPLRVESVAWIAERKDLLCGLFFLLSLLAYSKYAEAAGGGEASRGLGWRFSDRRYLVALGWFALALMSKPMAVSLPLILLILDWFPFGRMGSLAALRFALFEKVPFAVLSLVSSALTILAQKSGGAIDAAEAVALPARLALAARSLVAYLGKMLVPLDLTPYYPYPSRVSPWSAEYLGSIALVVGITAVCVALAVKKGQRLPLAVWACFVISLLPVIGLIQVGGQAMADRYTYLPGIGPSLLVGVAAARGLAWAWARRSRGLVVAGAGGALLCVMAALSFLTLRQIPVWRDGVTLWNDVLAQDEGKVPLAYFSRGVALKKAGQRERAAADFDQAIALDPTYYRAYNSRGVLYGEEGRPDKAIEYFDRSLAIDPGFASAYANRGFAYAVMGDFTRALQDLGKAIELDDRFANAFFSRGQVYLGTGSAALALQDFQRACDLGNDNGCQAVSQLGRGRTGR